MIVWYLDLQLPMQLVAISMRARCTTLCDKVCQWLATGRRFSPGPPVSSTNKTDRHDITEILLKVALNTIKQTNQITEHKKRLRQTSLEMHFPTCDAQNYGAVKQAYGIPTPLISGCPLHTFCRWSTIYNGNISIWYFSTVSFKITKSHQILMTCWSYTKKRKCSDNVIQIQVGSNSPHQRLRMRHFYLD